MAGVPGVALLFMAGSIGAELAAHLERRGVQVRKAQEEWEAALLLSAQDIDVAVIGPDAPPGVGLDLVRRFAGRERPLLVMTSRASELVDRVLVLELGAADYLGWPVDPRELSARIGGLIARLGKGSRDLLVLENSTVDLRAALVMHRNGREEQLSPGQIALLRLFLASPRKVLSRDDIIAAAPAESADAFDRSIDPRIARLRRKLATESITTIRGAGYRFDPPDLAPHGGAAPPGTEIADDC